MSELDEYLRGLFEEGLTHEAGQFSLAAQHARRKLREFQLDRPGLWLLKAAQSGSQLSCTRVTVRQTREFLSIGFDPQLEVLHLLDLLRDIHDLNTLRDPLTGHLAWAIQAALATEPHRFTIEFHLDSRGPQAYELNDSGATRLSKAPEISAGIVQLVRHEAPPQGLSYLLRHFNWVKTSRADIEALRQRARFLTRPLLLDGLALNDPTPEFCQGYPTVRYSSKYRAQDHKELVRGELWSVVWAHQSGAMALPDPAQRLDIPIKLGTSYSWQPLHLVRVRDHLTGRELFQGSPYNFAWAKGQVQGDTFFVPYPRYASACPGRNVGGSFSTARKPLCGITHLTWSVGNDEPARLIPVYLGVQLDPIEVDLPKGVIAMVSSDQWTSDLSQLQIIRDEHLARTLLKLTPILEELRLAMVDLLRVPKLARKCLIRDDEREYALELLQQTRLIEAEC